MIRATSVIRGCWNGCAGRIPGSRLILRQAAPTDLPREFAAAAAEAGLTDADRSFVVVLTRVLGPQGLQSWVDLLQNLPVDPAPSDFDDLPADADEATRQDVAERMIHYVHAVHAAHPELRDAQADAPRGSRFAARTADKALNDVYNSAQLDVLRRLESLLRGARRDDRT